MHITELRIRNYRNFETAKFSFKPGLNTLIGENGSGKTNVFQAIRLLLDESLERNAIYLRETDFCRSLGDWRGHWIVISAEFADLDTSEGCQMLRHAAGHMNGSNTGTCTFVFRPKKEIRKRMFELNGSNDEFSAYLKTIAIKDYEAFYTGRSSGNCLEDTEYESWAGSFDTATCPDPDDEDTGELGIRISPIYQEIACTFVRALRDVITDLRGFRGNPLLGLLRGMETDIQIADADRITQQVRTLNQDISSLDEIKELARAIEKALKSTVGHTYGPDVDITSSLPDSMDRLLQKLGIMVGEGSGSAYKGDLNEQSLGAANLIYLSLKLLEYERKLSTDRVAHFFLIEEPEAHIHTHIQKTLFANLPSQNTQVIVSTHSTHISSASKIQSVNVLAKCSDHAEVYQPANRLAPIEIRRVERYLDAVRSTLLFAKGVLLVEGDAELILIPALLRAAFGVTSDELGFSIISMSSAFFEHVSKLFSDDRIQRPCAILTDGDATLIELADNPAQDTERQARARRGQNIGQQRRTALEESTAENIWVEPFFASYTFEADFVQASNAPEIIRVLDEIYVDHGAIADSEALLKDDNPSVAGAEAVRLAKKEGKGWFAVLLAEQVDIWTLVPDYILRAIAFACHQSVNDNALRRLAEYRIKTITDSESPRRNVLLPLINRTDMDASQLIAAFRAAAPNDDLSDFCLYVNEYRDK